MKFVQGGMGWCAVVCMVWWGSDVICDAMVLMVWLVSQPMRCWRLCRVGARDHGALGAAVRDGAWVLRLRRLFGSCVGLASGAPVGNHIAQS